MQFDTICSVDPEFLTELLKNDLAHDYTVGLFSSRARCRQFGGGDIFLVVRKDTRDDRFERGVGYRVTIADRRGRDRGPVFLRNSIEKFFNIVADVLARQSEAHDPTRTYEVQVEELKSQLRLAVSGVHDETSGDRFHGETAKEELDQLNWLMARALDASGAAE
ncbi:MAG: hypothetical protein OXI35_02830 [Gemmatimonadota bacterium]|nr:hypothetical protein [Gemmatimonadota bacterium]